MYLNGTCVLGCTHNDVISIFQSISVGQSIQLKVCRGYSLPFDPSDPNTEIVTTVAVTSSKAQHTDTPPSYSDHHSELDSDVFDALQTPMDIIEMYIVKGNSGFGFTIADSPYGQKVKKILDRSRCRVLQEGDILLQINQNDVRDASHAEVVEVLKGCPRDLESLVVVQRGIPPKSPLTDKIAAESNGFISSTPKTADSTQNSPNTNKMTPSRPTAYPPNLSPSSRGYEPEDRHPHYEVADNRSHTDYGRGYRDDSYPNRTPANATPTNDFNTRDFVPASYYTGTPPRGQQQTARNVEGDCMIWLTTCALLKFVEIYKWHILNFFVVSIIMAILRCSVCFQLQCLSQDLSLSHLHRCQKATAQVHTPTISMNYRQGLLQLCTTNQE